MYDKAYRKPISCPTSAAAQRYMIRLLLVCIALYSYGCTSSYSTQGVKYSGKNAKKYTSLPIHVHEEKLVTMLETISSLFGIKYQYGGETIKGFDCSGFVQYIYLDTFDAYLPRTSRELSEIGRKIAVHRLRRGDLVFFRLNGRQIDHVGIYLDRNLFAHASLSRGITMGNLENRYYKKRFAKAVRLLEITESRRRYSDAVIQKKDMPD